LAATVLPFPLVGTNPEIENQRRGFWLRMSRERANLTQTAAASQLGLQSQAKSTISGWESGAREPRLRYLKAMAVLYGVPLDLFTDPPPTAYESIDERLRQLAGDAIELGLEDLEVAGESTPDDDVPPAAPPRRRTA
jgi:transcriptional regulator with XRE-family HTH domain